MRSILAQAHQVLIQEQQGAFYVVHERGTFFLYPFGHKRWRHRYWYRVDPWFEDADGEVFWVFNILGYWE